MTQPSSPDGRELLAGLRPRNIDEVRQELVELLECLLVDDDGCSDEAAIKACVTDEIVEEWRKSAGRRDDQHELLVGLGVDPWDLRDRDLWDGLYDGRSFVFDPELADENIALWDQETLDSQAAKLKNDRRSQRTDVADPIQNPSAPMTKRQAAGYIGNRCSVRTVNLLMRSGSLPYKQLSRQTFIFCRDQYPQLPGPK